MKTLLRILLILSLTLFMLGNRGCVTTDTVIVPEGPRAAELGKAKDEQIAALQKQVVDTEAQRAAEATLASKAASNVKGIVKAREYLPDTPAKEAIGKESDLALEKLPADDPVETVKALERVVLLITGQRDEALRLYREESEATKAAKREIAARDEALTKSGAAISERDQTIAQLGERAAAERAQHANDFKDALAKKDAQFADYKKAEAEKERATWVLWTRIAGLGFIVVGAVIAIMFKIVAEGASLVGVGVAIGLVSIFIDWLTAQIWFPWLCGGTILLVLGLGGYALYRMWKKNTLQVKVTAALQDLKDESTTLGNNLWSEVEQHLKYRLGDKGGVEQKKLVASIGLVNPEKEKA